MHLLLSLCLFPWSCALPADVVVWLLSVFLAARAMLIVGFSSALVLGLFLNAFKHFCHFLLVHRFNCTMITWFY